MTTRNTRFALLSSAGITGLAFQGAGWKLDADGKIEMKDGNPVYIDANGGELTMGTDTISRLNNEAKTLRQRAEKAEGVAEAFKGLDADTARKAVDTVKNIDAKKLIDAGEVDKVREEVRRELEGTIKEKDATIGQLTGQVDSMAIDNVFAGSDFVRDNIAVPLDMFKASFGSRFKRNEGGEIEAFYPDGNRVYSKERSGEPARPDEALRILVETHPQKDLIMKANGHGGSGNNGGGGQRQQSNVMKRGDFNALPANEQSAVGAKLAAGEISLVD